MPQANPGHKRPPHLLACISGHGYGHLAQTAPVLNALRQRLPGLLLSVRCTLPPKLLRARIDGPFQHLRKSTDIGMVMSSALDVMVVESYTAYQRLHRDWGLMVTCEAQTLREVGADFVLSNVGYLPLAGAHRAGIPCAGMSSINWADVYTHYCAAFSGALHTGQQMRHAYANARAFLQLTPSMPMTDLANRIAIGPSARIRHQLRNRINRELALEPGTRLVMISLGGVAGRLPVERWPRIADVRWLVQASWRVNHPDACNLEALEMDFSDILASCDALICKPGYGSFVEAACNGVPVLYVSRPDWPETAALTTWLHAHAAAVMVSRSQLESGNIAAQLEALWQMPRPPRPTPAGVDEAADWLARQLVTAHSGQSIGTHDDDEAIYE